MRIKPKEKISINQIEWAVSPKQDLSEGNPELQINSNHMSNTEKPYCFFIAEDGNEKANESLQDNSGSSIDGYMLTKITSDEFCKKYCGESITCRGAVVVSSPIVSENRRNKSNSGSGNFLPNPITQTQLISEFSQPGDLFSKHPRKQGISTLVGSYDQGFLQKVTRLIEFNYTDYRFCVEKLAHELSMSVSQMNRRLNAVTGYPAGFLIRFFRLQCAAEQLVNSKNNISEICFKTGFNDVSYFSRAFKKQYGFTPSEYRKMMVKKSGYMRE